MYVIRAMVRGEGEDDFKTRYASTLFYGDRSTWYENPVCAMTFKEQGEARKYFTMNKERLLKNREYSVALDTIEICRVDYVPAERINVL